MSDLNSGCRAKCWGGAALIGLLTAIMLIVASNQTVLAAIVLGALTCAMLGALFSWLFCAPIPKSAKSVAGVAGTAGGMGAYVAEDVRPGGNAAATQQVRAEVEAAAQGSKPDDSATADPDTQSGTGTDGAADASDATGTDQSDAASPKADVAAADAQADAEAGASVKPSKALAGQDDLAARKGEWKYEANASQGGDDDSAATATDDAGPKDANATKAADADKSASGATIKPSTALAGEAELASRKGSWKYEGDASGAGSSDAAASGTRADVSDEDYDRDGKLEGTDEGEKPAMMDAPRDGGPDNLKEIKGIGPKLEKLCHSMGIYHFDQIAAWTDQEVAWVNANLQGFKGRVTRDDWVGQAKILMTGEETEFSQRVEDGKVY